MSQGERHELKFVLDYGRLAVAEQWLYEHTDLRRSYGSRWVNSLYFDDTCYSAVRDNLSGISDRRKVRLRWYHSGDRHEISRATLEIKSRKNRFGRKDSYEMPGMEDHLLDLSSDQLIGKIEGGLVESEAIPEPFGDFLAPSLHVAYRRDYFQSDSGVRITFDRNIHFTMPVPGKKILEGPNQAYPTMVMEVKFPDELSDEVCRMIRPLPLSVKRHSKYLTGLASFGHALYT